MIGAFLREREPHPDTERLMGRLEASRRRETIFSGDMGRFDKGER